MAEPMTCRCGAAPLEPLGRNGYPGLTGYEYVTFACGWSGTRARNNGQFAYTGAVRIAPPRYDPAQPLSQEELANHGWLDSIKDAEAAS